MIEFINALISDSKNPNIPVEKDLPHEDKKWGKPENMELLTLVGL